jgi:hypothetical protein
MTGTDREVWVRYKPDASLDEVWREPVPWWKKTQEQRNAALLNDLLRNHPGMTREEAQEQIDLFG